MKTTLDIQRRLAELGFDCGALDGIRGRQTIAAVKRYQASMHLAVDGLVGPNTLRALFGGAVVAASDSPDAMPWLVEARRLMGTKEVAGKGNSSDIMDWADHLDIVYPGDDVAWCGLFVAHCVGSTLPEEVLPTNPLGARNWASFGQPSKIVDGAIAVFWRGTKAGWLGHVGFVVGQTATSIDLLGGNQSDAVNIRQMPKNRLLDCRWPRTALKLETVTAGGKARPTDGNEA